MRATLLAVILLASPNVMAHYSINHKSSEDYRMMPANPLTHHAELKAELFKKDDDEYETVELAFRQQVFDRLMFDLDLAQLRGDFAVAPDVKARRLTFKLAGILFYNRTYTVNIAGIYESVKFSDIPSTADIERSGGTVFATQLLKGGKVIDYGLTHFEKSDQKGKEIFGHFKLKVPIGGNRFHLVFDLEADDNWRGVGAGLSYIF